MFPKNKSSAGGDGNGRSILLLCQSASVKNYIPFDQVHFGRADQGHRQLDRPQSIVKGQTASTVVADGVGASAVGGKYSAPLGEIVRSAGDTTAPIGEKHAGFAIRHTADAIVKIEPLNLVNVLSIEAGVGEVSFGDEASYGPIVGSTSSAEQKKKKAQ